MHFNNSRVKLSYFSAYTARQNALLLHNVKTQYKIARVVRDDEVECSKKRTNSLPKHWDLLNCDFDNKHKVGTTKHH